MASVFCTQCGQQNPDDSKFCARCGASLTLPAASGTPAADQTTTISMPGIEASEEHPDELTDVAVESLPSGSALLVVKRGPNAGSRFLLDKDVTTVGRHPEVHFLLDAVPVPRRHGEFHRSAEGLSVRDVASL